LVAHINHPNNRGNVEVCAVESSDKEITASLMVNESPPVVPSFVIAIEFFTANPSSFEVCAGSIATSTRPGVSLIKATPTLSNEIVAPTL
jgi:hypothetical protein